ncbi:MAG: hypothetical protein C7N36_07940 [Bacteroidetes bacterium]|nr:MAG: hypothetical protein C7N36_07940 [Bacteroidota bacterium]
MPGTHVVTTAIGCDVLAVNSGDPVRYSATGDECYKLAITYDVINWCLWDGEYDGYVLPRMTEDDGEDLPVDRAVSANERPVVRYSTATGLVIDRDHENQNGTVAQDQWFVLNPGDDSNIADNMGVDQPLPNDGRYRYTQFIKIYDSSAPVVTVGEYGGPTDLCPSLAPGQFGDAIGSCEAPVSIPFSVSDACELIDGRGNLVVTMVSAELDAFAVDANRDGTIKANEFVADADVMGNMTSNGDGTYVFSGTFPIITAAMGDNIVHAIRVLFEDGCGNRTSRYIEFDVVDCKGPAPVCINGLTVTLMPQTTGGCAMEIWASDFEGSPIFDCTGQGPETNDGLLRVTQYAIYRASDVAAAGEEFVPDPDNIGLLLTQDDEEFTVVRVYAFDEEGNFDFCETYFSVQQHSDCNLVAQAQIAGQITTETNVAVSGVEVNVSGDQPQLTLTNEEGFYGLSVTAGADISVVLALNANPLNGVTTFDLVLISKHILGVRPLNSPYKLIAADANRSGTISTLDMIQLRKLILNIDTAFTQNTSWRFVDANYVFPDPTNPWLENFPEFISENNISGDLSLHFMGVKIGDVNNTAQANLFAGGERQARGHFNLEVADQLLSQGQEYHIPCYANNLEDIQGFQGTLALQGADLLAVEYNVARAENFGWRFQDEGILTMSWNAPAGQVTELPGATLVNKTRLFTLVIRATENKALHEVLGINSRYTAAEAYRQQEEILQLGIEFRAAAPADHGFEVYQNVPNPFQDVTALRFYLPEAADVHLTIHHLNGQQVLSLPGSYAAGFNQIKITPVMLSGATGILSYTLQTGQYALTRRMVILK